MTEEELEHIGILGMHWGKKKGKIIKSPIIRTKGQKIRDDIFLGQYVSERVGTYMTKGDTRARALLKGLAPTIVGAGVAGGYLAYSVLKENPHLIKAGVRAAQDFMLKYGSKNIYTSSGEIIMNPRNYRVVRDATRLLR